MPEIELTNKQSIVLDRWLSGETQTAIAHELGCSVPTINIMLKGIAKKFPSKDWIVISGRKKTFSYEING